MVGYLTDIRGTNGTAKYAAKLDGNKIEELKQLLNLVELGAWKDSVIYKALKTKALGTNFRGTDMSQAPNKNYIASMVYTMCKNVFENDIDVHAASVMEKIAGGANIGNLWKLLGLVVEEAISTLYGGSMNVLVYNTLSCLYHDVYHVGKNSFLSGKSFDVIIKETADGELIKVDILDYTNDMFDFGQVYEVSSSDTKERKYVIAPELSEKLAASWELVSVSDLPSGNKLYVLQRDRMIFTKHIYDGAGSTWDPENCPKQQIHYTERDKAEDRWRDEDGVLPEQYVSNSSVNGSWTKNFGYSSESIFVDKETKATWTKAESATLEWAMALGQDEQYKLLPTFIENDRAVYDIDTQSWMDISVDPKTFAVVVLLDGNVVTDYDRKVYVCDWTAENFCKEVELGQALTELYSRLF